MMKRQREKRLTFCLFLILLCNLRDVVVVPTVNSFSISSLTLTHTYTHTQKYQQELVNSQFHHKRKRNKLTIQRKLQPWKKHNHVLHLQNDNNCNNDVNYNDKYYEESKALSEIHILLDQLYPPSDLSKRTSTSRSDGYWSYLEKGQEPPKHLTYGEFDLMFFSKVLEKAFTLLQSQNGDGGNTSDSTGVSRGKTFVDIGSGTGRLVIGAAALHPELKLSKGIEILPRLHESAMQYLSQCLETIQDDNDDDDGDDRSIVDNSPNSQQDQDLELEREDRNYDNDDNIDDNSIVDDNVNNEPLSNQMNNMIGALQEMTAEEWKAILGDYEMEEGEFIVDDDENNLEEEEEEQVNSNLIDTEIITGVLDTSDATNINDTIDKQLENEIGDNEENEKGDNKDSENDEYEQQQKDLVEKYRSSEEEIHPNFILPAEMELLGDSDVGNDDIDEENEENVNNKNEEDNGNRSNDMHYFESLDDFLNTPDAQLKKMFSSIDEKNQEDKPKQLNKDRDCIVEEVNAEKCNVQDGRPVYKLKRLKIDPKGGAKIGDDEIPISLPLSPISFSCGSFEDPYEYISDADLVFVFSTCWTNDMMASLGKCIGRQCKPGTIAITTEFQIPLSGEIEKVDSDASLPYGEYEMELLDTIDGYCSATGGISTAYVHRVVKSLYEEGVGPRERPIVSKDEIAWKIIQDYEAKKLTDTEKFVRNTKNKLAFYSIDYNIDLS